MRRVALVCAKRTLRFTDRAGERVLSILHTPSWAAVQAAVICALLTAGYVPELIIPAPTVTPVASSIRMNEPVVRFCE